MNKGLLFLCVTWTEKFMFMCQQKYFDSSRAFVKTYIVQLYFRNLYKTTSDQQRVINRTIIV